MKLLESLLLAGLLFLGLLFLGVLVGKFLFWRFNGHGSGPWYAPTLRRIRRLARTPLIGIEYSQPGGESPRQPRGGQGLASTPILPCTMFPLPQQPDRLTIPEVPLGPARALCRAVDESCRSGPITLQFLNGNPKAIVVPWYGDLTVDPESYDPERGDGEACYSEPNCDLWQELPAHMTPENWRLAVPVWLIAATSREAFARGQGEVILSGHMHPLHNAALVDYYDGGVFQSRRYFWDSKISLRQIMLINLAERLDELHRAGAFLGPVPLLAPRWLPRQGTAVH